MTPETEKSLPRLELSWPMSLVLTGLLAIVASFLPLGDWAAQRQWTAEDSAAFDKLSMDYKEAVYQPPARAGLSESEHQAQLDRMKEQIAAMQAKLGRARSQPARWSRYLLIVGTLLTGAGFFAHTARR